MGRLFYVHSLPDRPESEWDTIAEHEERVAALCREFLERIDPGLDVLGRWHDLGKYSDKFHQYLQNANASDIHVGEIRGRVDHSTAGTQHVQQSLEHLGRLG